MFLVLHDGYLSPMVTEVSLFEYCRTSTLVSRVKPISRFSWSVSRDNQPTRFEVCETVSICALGHSRTFVPISNQFCQFRMRIAFVKWLTPTDTLAQRWHTSQQFDYAMVRVLNLYQGKAIVDTY